MKHTIINNSKYLLYCSFSCLYQAISQKSNLTNKDADMQMILKKLTYNAVSVAGTKLSFPIPTPILYPHHMIYALLAT